MEQNNILSMLSIAAKAKKVVSGEFMTEQAVKEGKAYLVVVAEDASENTKKMFRDKCSFYEIPIYLYASKEMLGNAIGRQFRASLAVLDPGFANSLEEKLKIAVKTE